MKSRIWTGTAHDLDPGEFYASLAEGAGKTGDDAVAFVKEMMEEDGVPVPEEAEAEDEDGESEGEDGESEDEDEDEVAAEVVKLDPTIVGARIKQAWNVNPPQDCATCHR